VAHVRLPISHPDSAAMQAAHRPLADGVLIAKRRQFSALQRYEFRFRGIYSDQH